MFIKYKPKGSGGQDCVVRAIHKALDVTYTEALMLLFHKEWWALLDERGFERYVFTADSEKGRPTVGQAAAIAPKGRPAVIQCARHLVFAIDGDWYDDQDNGLMLAYAMYVGKEG